MNYYITIQNEQKGPYTLAQIEAMWSTGAITADALFCAEGMSAWEKIEALIAPAGRRAESGHDFMSSLLARAKALAQSLYKWAWHPGQRVALVLAATSLVAAAAVHGIREKSFWSFLFVFQGLTPGALIGNGLLIQSISAFAALVLITIFFASAWRSRHMALTIAFCGFVYLSATLGLERLGVVDLFLKLQSENKRQAAVIESTKNRAITEALGQWLSQLEQKKQTVFEIMHSFPGTATSIDPNGISATMDPDTETEVKSGTLVFTLHWKGPDRNGHTKFEIKTDTKIRSFRVLESTEATIRPIGTELMPDETSQ